MPAPLAPIIVAIMSAAARQGITLTAKQAAKIASKQMAKPKGLAPASRGTGSPESESKQVGQRGF